MMRSIPSQSIDISGFLLPISQQAWLVWQAMIRTVKALWILTVWKYLKQLWQKVGCSNTNGEARNKTFPHLLCERKRVILLYWCKPQTRRIWHHFCEIIFIILYRNIRKDLYCNKACILFKSFTLISFIYTTLRFYTMNSNVHMFFQNVSLVTWVSLYFVFVRKFFNKLLLLMVRSSENYVNLGFMCLTLYAHISLN